MADDKIKNLYQTFVTDGYDMEPEAEFRQNLKKPAKRRAAYDALVADGYDMEPYDQFEANIGFSSSSSAVTEATGSQPVGDVLSTGRKLAASGVDLVSPKPHYKEVAEAQQPKTATIPQTVASAITSIGNRLAKPAPASSKYGQYYKLRRGGSDFTVPSAEIKRYGGVKGWAKAHSGSPVLVYMQKPDGSAIYTSVDNADARLRAGYKFSTFHNAVSHRSQQVAKPAATTDASQVPDLAPEPQGAKGLTEDERIRMGMNRMLGHSDAVLRNIHQQVENIHRSGSFLSMEERKRRQAAEWGARMAGLNPTLHGLKPPTGNNSDQTATATSQSPYNDNIASPFVNRVVYLQDEKTGKFNPTIEWQLPDGSLTTNRFEAENAEYIASENRKWHDKVRRMKAAGYDPNNFNDIAAFQAAEGRDKIQLRLDMAEANLRQLMKQRAEQMDQQQSDFLSIVGSAASQATANMHSASQSQHSGAQRKSSLDHDIEIATAEVARLSQDLRLYDQRVSASDKKSVGKTLQGLWDGITDPNTWTGYVYDLSVNSTIRQNANADRLSKSAAMSSQLLASAPDPGGWYSGGRFVGEMVGDPVTYLSLGAGKGGAWAAQKAVSLMAPRAMARDVAGRYVSRNIVTRVLAHNAPRVASSTSNFFAFEGLRDARQQAIDGGWTDADGNFHSGFSWAHAFRQGGHGALMGTAMGIFGAGMGNAGNWAVRQVDKFAAKTSKAGLAAKATIRTVQYAGSVLGEGTIFALPEIYEFHTMPDDKFDSLYAETFGYSDITDPTARKAARDKARNSLKWDAWDQSIANIAGMKLAGGIQKLAQNPIGTVKGTLGPIFNHGRLSLVEVLNERLSRTPFDIQFTADEINELKQAGYTDIAGLFTRDKSTRDRLQAEAKKKKEEAAAERKKERQAQKEKVKKLPFFMRPFYDYVDYEQPTAANPDKVAPPKPGEKPEVPDGYEQMTHLMDDKSVSAATRAKAYFILTGHMLPAPTIASGEIVNNADGTFTVRSLAKGKEVVTSRTYSSKRQAQIQLDAINRQVELNRFDVAEKQADFLAAEITKKAGISLTADQLKKLQAKVKAGKATEQERKQYEAYRYLQDKWSAEGLRKYVRRETGVDIDYALRTLPKDRAPEQQKAIDQYQELLRADEPPIIDSKLYHDANRVATSEAIGLSDKQLIHRLKTSPQVHTSDRDRGRHDAYVQVFKSRYDAALNVAREEADSKLSDAEFAQRLPNLEYLYKRSKTSIKEGARYTAWAQEFNRRTRLEQERQEPQIRSLSNSRLYHILRDRSDITSITDLARRNAARAEWERRRTAASDKKKNGSKADSKATPESPKPDGATPPAEGQEPASTLVTAPPQTPEPTPRFAIRDSMSIPVRDSDKRQQAQVLDTEGDKVTLWSPLPLNDKSREAEEISGYITDLTANELAAILPRDKEGRLVYKPAEPTPAESKPDSQQPAEPEQPENTKEGPAPKSKRSANTKRRISHYRGKIDEINERRRQEDLTDEDRTKLDIEEINAIQGIANNLSVAATDPAKYGITAEELAAEQQRVDQDFARLREQGYEIEDYAGTDYNELMLLGKDVEFKLNEDLPLGTRRITKTTKPQVHKNGELVQKASVIVGQNYIGESEEAHDAYEEQIRGEQSKESEYEAYLQRMVVKEQKMLDAIAKLGSDPGINRYTKRLERWRQRNDSTAPDGPGGGEPSDPTPEPAPEPEQSRSALARVPLDKNGKPQFTAVDPETAWDALVEKTQDEEMAQTYADNMVKTKEAALKKAEKAKPKPNEDIDAFIASENQRKQAIDAARREFEHWQKIASIPADRIKAEQQRIKAEQEAEKAEEQAFQKEKQKVDKRNRDLADECRDYPEALEELQNQEPRDLMEAAAYLLSRGYKLLLSSKRGSRGITARGYRDETGYGREEAQAMIGLFATAEKGGISIEVLSEDPMLEVCDEFGIPYDQLEARNAILNLLQVCRTRGAIYGYIAANRRETARQILHYYQDQELGEYEYYCEQAYGMTIEEFEAYQEMMEAELADRDLHFDQSEFYSNLADELAARRHVGPDKPEPQPDNGPRQAENPAGSPNRTRQPAADASHSESPLPGTGRQRMPEAGADTPARETANDRRPGLRPQDGIPSTPASEPQPAPQTEIIDGQGNPVDEQGKLIVERVGSVDEITDADFTAPTRNIALPTLPANVADAIGADGRTIVIKKNVFLKNHTHHKDLTPAQSREILLTALYHPELYGQNKKASRPCNWILIHLADKNTSVIIEVNADKENLEIVNWHYLKDAQLEQKRRQAEREGGLILTLPEESVAGDAPNGLSSGGKVTTSPQEKQENRTQSSDDPALLDAVDQYLAENDLPAGRASVEAVARAFNLDRDHAARILDKLDGKKNDKPDDPQPPAGAGLETADNKEPKSETTDKAAAKPEQNPAEHEPAHGDQPVSDRVREEEETASRLQSDFDKGLDKQGGNLPLDTKPAKKRKLNLHDFHANNSVRQFLTGIYHDPEGYAVATDGRCMIVSRDHYDPQHAGMLVPRKGDPVKPNPILPWQNVMDRIAKSGTTVPGLPSALQGRLEGMRSHIAAALEAAGEKATPAKIADQDVAIRIPDGHIFMYRFRYIERLLNGARALGIDTLAVSPTAQIHGTSQRGSVLICGSIDATEGSGRTSIAYAKAFVDLASADHVASPAAADRLLGHAVTEMVRRAGVEVVTDTAEMQAVLDAHKALQARTKKPAPDTAVPFEKDQATVVSETDGAKILQNLDSLAKNIGEKAESPVKSFRGALSQALGLKPNSVHSSYGTFETVNGVTLRVRVSDHNASSKSMSDAGFNEALSIVITRQPNNGMTPGGDAHIVEYYYNSYKLDKAGAPTLAAIVSALRQALYSGEFRDPTGLAERQELNPIQAHRVFHGTGARFDAFDHSHMAKAKATRLSAGAPTSPKPKESERPMHARIIAINLKWSSRVVCPSSIMPI